MNELIAQIRAAAEAGLYYLALFGALTLPDICGALDSKEGTASGSKYKDWIRRNVPEQASEADLIWGLRCSLLHQGRALPSSGVVPIAFTLPTGGPQVHKVSTIVSGQQVGWMSIPIFVDEITRGAEQWFQRFGKTKRVKRNIEKFAHIRPEGLPPHVAGFPVVA
jgi:hypothetical protein